MKIIKLSIILLAGLTISSCVFYGKKGNRKVTTEIRQVPETYTAIEVSQGIDIQLKQGDYEPIHVELDENLQENLVTELEDAVLHIYFDTNVGKRAASNVYLSMPIIKAISTSSGAEVESLNSLEINDLEIDTSSGSNVALSLQGGNVTCNSSSGSDIKLSGKVMSLDVDASSGSDIDATKLKAENVEANVSSGADIDVYASQSITASASSGGDITCHGSPADKNINKSSGGDVRIR